MADLAQGIKREIKVLDKHTAELIAAGEVVERPSSVVKELMENSVDAGATAITVEIENGGVTLIRITDNGSGILREQVPTAFLRHATSKVKNADDLEKIGTLGFRGEALPSVATVSRLEMLTCTEGEDAATRYVIHGGEEKLFDDGAHPIGTTIYVRDLFYNVPARLKFLKKDVSEGNSVARVVDFIALSNPHISVKFIREGKEELKTSGNGDLKSTIYEIFGKSFSDTLVGVDYSLNGVKIQGFTSKPACGRGNRSGQMFFINGRYVKSGTAAAALAQSYRGQVMTGKFPACVLYIELPFELVDVNVHPAKIEVRFVNEKPIFDAVYYGVKSALAGNIAPSEISLKRSENPFVDASKADTNSGVQQKFDINRVHSNERGSLRSGIKADNPVVARDNTAKALYSSGLNDNAGVIAYSPISRADIPKATDISHSAPKTEKEDDFFGFIDAVPANAGVLSDGKIKPRNVSIDIAYESSEEGESAIDEDTAGNQVEAFQEPLIVSEEKAAHAVRFVGEIFKNYILAEMGEDIYIIDKHAAHERIILDELKSGYNVTAQMLLSPVAINLGREAHSALMEEQESLAKAGFEVDDFGGSSVIVRATPMLLDGIDIEKTILEIADGLLDGRADGDYSTAKLDWIFHSTACRAAVKAGDKSTKEELSALAERVLLDDDVKTCPHGRPVSYKLSKKEIEKQFGRIV